MGLVRQSATTFASRILITVVNIPISILVARTLGVDGQGVYAAAQAFTALWATIWLVGVDAAQTWGLASGRTTLGRALGNGIVWLLVLSALAVPGFLLASRLLDPEKTRSLLPVLGIAAAIVPLILARSLLLSCFLGLGQIDQYNLLNVASQVVLLAGLVVVLVFGDGGPREAVAVFGGSIALMVVLGAVWVARRRRVQDPVRLDGGFLATSLSYGARGYGATLFGQLNYRFDQVLVTQMAGIREQGYYSIAVLLAEKLTHITNSIQLVLFPKVSASSAQEANRVTTAACRHGLFWVGVSGAILFLLRKPLVGLLYGAPFLPALLPFAYLLPGIFLLTFSKILTVDLSGRNKRFATTVATGIALIVNTALNLLWIPRHGMLGAAWSSAIAYAVQSAMMVLFFLKVSGVPARKLVLPERGDLELYRRLLRRAARLARGERG